MLLLSPPVVSAALPSVTLPAPDKEASVSENPSKFSVAPEFTVTALESGMVSVAPLASVPPATVVGPL
ncbi:MAG: hypothetical protein LZF86_250053 [Nitrospira sp.]|nr:MAG: hypothetical protein LZF86_250053 [Nitrospira sp.]